MTSRDLFQTGLRVTGVIFLYFSIPKAIADILTLSDTLHGLSGGAAFGVIFRILWEILVPLRLVAGAPSLTRRLYSNG